MNKRLKQIKGRLNAATEGKWYAYSLDEGYSGVNYEDDFSLFSSNVDGSVYTYKNDAEFIVNSKDDIQYLLDLVEQLQNTNNNLHNEAQNYFDTLVDEQGKALRYEEALKFYSTGYNYNDTSLFGSGRNSKTKIVPPVIRDNGNKAREALEEK